MTTAKAPPTLDEIHKGRTNIYRIPAKYIKAATLSTGERLNVRDDFGTEEEQEELARSIAEHGIKQPLLGTWTDGVFYYDDGDRRMNAHRIAVAKFGLKGEAALVPIRRQPRAYSEEERTMDLLTLNSGKNLNMYEAAKAMLRLTTLFGKTPADVAKAKGCSETHVKTCLALLTESAPGVQAAVASGQLAATTAAALVHEVSSIEEQEEVLAKARDAAAEAGVEKITARHIPIPLGKKAQEARRETPTPPPLPSGHGEQYPEAVVPRKDSDVFAGEDTEPTSAQVNDFGEFISGIINRPIAFSVQGVSGSVGLALRNGEWFKGIVVKWPGKSKDDGFLKIAPSLRSAAYSSNQLAEVDGAMLLRSELEAKEFKGKREALADLDRHIEKLTRALNPEDAKAHSEAIIQPVDTSDLPGKAKGVNARTEEKFSPSVVKSLDDAYKAKVVEELKALISDVPAGDAEKDRLKTLKYVTGWLQGKLPRKEVVKYLLGIVDKVEAPGK